MLLGTIHDPEDKNLCRPIGNYLDANFLIYENKWLTDKLYKYDFKTDDIKRCITIRLDVFLD